MRVRLFIHGAFRDIRTAFFIGFFIITVLVDRMSLTMPTDFGAIMREMQNLKSRFESMQGELAGMEVGGEAGGGMVRVTLNGQFEVSKVQIEPDAMNDRDMLEDLIAAATNNAVQHVREAIQERYSGLAGGLTSGMLPGL